MFVNNMFIELFLIFSTLGIIYWLPTMEYDDFAVFLFLFST